MEGFRSVMFSFIRFWLLALIGFVIFFVMLVIAVCTHNDTLMIISFVWLFAMWPIAEVINTLI